MKALIIPDLHEPPEPVLADIESLITRQEPDRVIFLGDFFDRFSDTPADAARTAEWLKASLADPRRAHLVGNHDACYLWPCEATFCPGFSWEKEAAIRTVLGPALAAMPFVFHACVDGWLLTHAGLSASWVPAGLHPDVLDLWLTAEAQKARASFAADLTHWFASVGANRGGRSAAGGILWCDFRELRPVPGVRQIFGHTPADHPRWIGKDHLCLDTNMGQGPRHYAVVTDGALKVRPFPAIRLNASRLDWRHFAPAAGTRTGQ